MGFAGNLPCERAFELQSLELDGCLSEVEREALAAHLRGCPSCAGAGAEMRRVTLALREAPAEVPAGTFVAQPRRSRPRRRAVAISASLAAAALTSAVVGALVASPPPGTNAPPPRVLVAQRTVNEANDFRDARRSELTRSLPRNLAPLDAA
jgi:anti-sigma factor RsiW